MQLRSLVTTHHLQSIRTGHLSRAPHRFGLTFAEGFHAVPVAGQDLAAHVFGSRKPMEYRAVRAKIAGMSHDGCEETPQTVEK